LNLAWLVPMVSASALGSLHCLGMCGGLLAAASHGAEGRRERGLVQLTYQGARLGSYVVLGALAGLLGHALDLAGRAAGLSHVAAVVAGVTMTLAGLLAMLQAAGVRLGRGLSQLRLPAAWTRWLAGSARRSPLVRAGILGGASALLPCGFLYAFAIAGAATGSPVGGALVTAALWLGTLPALLGFGLLLSGMLSRVRRHIPLVSAASVFALGLFTLSHRVNVPAVALETMMKPGAGAMPADCPYHSRRTP
jgi:uncharacterized protein